MIVMYGKGKVGESVFTLCSYLGLSAVLMDDTDKDDDILHDAQYIVVTPGIKQSHNIYRLYMDKILCELDFLYIYKDFFPFYASSIFIGITGTNGKSTTSSVLYKTLDSYISHHLYTYTTCRLAGNFSTPLSAIFLQILINNVDANRHIFVVETSSFMLAHMRLFLYDYGVLLNISRDHLDRHDTMDNYSLAKENILIRSKKGFISQNMQQFLTKKYDHISCFSDYTDLSNTHFLGNHNKQNLGAVAAVCDNLTHDMGREYMNLSHLFSTIYPLPHRLNPIKKIRGITIVDDGICTSAAACQAAITALPEQCVLILGGYDKGDDYTILSSLFATHVTYIVAFGQIAQRIGEIATAAGLGITFVQSLNEAVQVALDKAFLLKTHYVLFSPAAASFDMFTNVYDRVDQFTRIVENIS